MADHSQIALDRPAPQPSESKPMNPYEAKQEARRERYLDLAHKAKAESAARFDRAHKAIEHIPFGQPILVGHHSERHHRADLNRHDRNMRAAIDADKKAAHYLGKAAGVGNAGISSDDPEAVTKLRAELADLEAMQARMVAANKCVRKQDRAGLAALGFSEAMIGKLFTPDFCGRIGFADYQTKNNGANIRRIKARIEQLQRNATREHKEIVRSNGIRLVQNVEANRLQIFFPAIPAEEVRRELKSCGFRWSPTEGAWQRHLSNGAIYAAGAVVRKIEEKEAAANPAPQLIN